MSYNGSGTFQINTAGQPVVSGTVISSTAFNALTADLATGLSTCITKDGQTTITANIPMGNNKITGLAVGTAATDAANLSQVQSTAAKLINSVSGADTVTGVLSPTLGAYAAGQMFYWVAAGDNTGAVTLNIDSLGAKAVTRDGTTALAAGDIQSGEVCVVVYDGTRFQLINGASQSASITTENLTVNKATVLNESGGNNDTRIEGDTDQNLVFVDASADAVGIGTASPLGRFNVAGTTPVTWVGSGNSSALVTIGTQGTSGGSLLVNTASLNSSFASGLAIDGTYESFSSVVNIKALGVYSGGGYGSSLAFHTSSNTALTERMRLDSSGNLGIGTSSPQGKLQVAGGTAQADVYFSGRSDSSADVNVGNLYARNENASFNGCRIKFDVSSTTGTMMFWTATGGTIAERARITSGGVFRINTTTSSYSAANAIMDVNGGSTAAAVLTTSGGATYANLYCHNTATSGDNTFIDFGTEGTWTSRGSITYNRPGGVVAYNTTSDYRSKDVYGPIQNPGETIDALKIYRGKMKGATIERPMMIAHEAQEVVPYAVSGEKDAVNEDGTPKYQTMDHQILVPLLIAELQSLRKRVAELEAK